MQLRRGEVVRHARGAAQAQLPVGLGSGPGAQLLRARAGGPLQPCGRETPRPTRPPGGRALAGLHHISAKVLEVKSQLKSQHHQSQSRLEELALWAWRYVQEVQTLEFNGSPEKERHPRCAKDVTAEGRQSSN